MQKGPITDITHCREFGSVPLEWKVDYVVRRRGPADLPSLIGNGISAFKYG
jgi:hypothetical protein